MRHWIALLSLLPLAASAAGAPSALKDLARRPSLALLAAFTEDCTREHPLDFSGGKTLEDEFLRKARRTGNIYLLRALVYAYGHCTDGASTESLRMALGNEILQQHAKELLAALAAENAAGIARELAKAENESFLGVDCQDKKCQSAKARFYQRKVKALRRAKVRGAAEPIKASMLDAIAVAP